MITVIPSGDGEEARCGWGRGHVMTLQDLSVFKVKIQSIANKALLGCLSKFLSVLFTGHHGPISTFSVHVVPLFVDERSYHASVFLVQAQKFKSHRI